MVFAIWLLVFGLFFLGFAANFLITSSVRIAKYFKISTLLIWLTVIAFGTSAPELFLSAMAAVNGSWSLSVGNVIGSNIFNLGFILGLSAIIAPIIIQKKLVYRDGLFLLLITWLIFVMLWDQYVLWREWVILISLLIGYISYLRIKKESIQEEEIDNSKPKVKNLLYIYAWLIVLSFIHTSVFDWSFSLSLGFSLYSTIFIGVITVLFILAFIKKDLPHFNNKSNWMLLNMIKLIASLGLLVLSSEHVVSAAVYIAQVFGISEWAIWATIVAAGTSLPEIAATVAAIIKKNYDMGVGNVIWSDIFNILWIIGISSIISPLTLNPSCVILSECSSGLSLLFRDNIFSVAVLFITLWLTFFFMRTWWKLSKREWIVLFSFALIRMAFEINPSFFTRLFG
jgi:cation:H+ antiporter